MNTDSCFAIFVEYVQLFLIDIMDEKYNFHVAKVQPQSVA